MASEKSSLQRHLPHWFMLLVGVCVVVMAIQSCIGIKKAEDWPTVQGHILKSEVEEGLQRVNGKSRTIYIASVDYRFIVNGENYKGRQISFGSNEYSSRSAAEKELEKYPAKKDVMIYYDPSDPNNCVLENDEGRGSFWLTVLLGLILAAWGGFKALQNFPATSPKG